MDLKDALAKPYYWTAFGFPNTDPNDYHCTHKFLGDLNQSKVKQVRKIISEYFAQNPLKKFKPKFDTQEMFGPKKDVRVLTTSESLDVFHLNLRERLNQFRHDDYPRYKPHVTCENEKIWNKPISSYYLMRGKVPMEKWEAKGNISEAKKKKKKKKCKCNWLYCDPECKDKSHRWAFAPFYGRGDGKSDAAISTGTSTGNGSGGGAYPGAGGINMPGVPAGPNSGMGPITMSRDNFSGQAINEDLQLISTLCRE